MSRFGRILGCGLETEAPLQARRLLIFWTSSGMGLQDLGRVEGVSKRVPYHIIASSILDYQWLHDLLLGERFALHVCDTTSP